RWEEYTANQQHQKAQQAHKTGRPIHRVVTKNPSTLLIFPFISIAAALSRRSPLRLKSPHNNVVPNGHFKKHWQNYVKTWFDQPARKYRRRLGKQKKAAKIFPRPSAGPLRPIVRCQTQKYNMKVRAGRGFSLEELKAAGIPKKLAPTIGIAVDHRRRNSSLESLQANVQRLKTYKAKLVVFPKHARKIKAGDSTPEELATATQAHGDYLPIGSEKQPVEIVKLTEEMKAFNAYAKVRLERTNKRKFGIRQKKAAEAEKEEKK
ncbi:Large ribosomal subunit protein eL13y-like protein, partial [Drosera capensis]